MNFIPAIERGSSEAIKAFQTEKLRELIHYLAKHSPFYRDLFQHQGIQPESIQTLEDLCSLPTTTKEQLQEHNADFLCVTSQKVIEFTRTSGTLGKPITIALTDNDIKRLAYNEYLSFTCAEFTANDRVQLMVTLDRQFMAGLAYYEGLRKLGAGIIRMGPGTPAMHWEGIVSYKPTALVSVPSTLLSIIDFAIDQGINLNTSSVQKIVCIGEGIRNTDLLLNSLGKRIVQHWNVNLNSTYASTEMQTAFTECAYGKGGHHHPELLIVELLDENKNPVGDGEPGEIVITTLGVEGMPLLRYETGDIAIAFTQPCVCGRNTMRLSPIIGRKKQCIKLKGTTLYPQAIIETIRTFPGVNDFLIKISSNSLSLDEVTLFIALKDIQQQELLIDEIKDGCKKNLRVVPEILVVNMIDLQRLRGERPSRKLIQVMDTRNS